MTPPLDGRIEHLPNGYWHAEVWTWIGTEKHYWSTDLLHDFTEAADWIIHMRRLITDFKPSVTPETDPTPSPVTPRSEPGQQQGDRNERSAGSP